MNIFKKEVSESDKYWHREFKKLYGFESSFSMKITLMLIKQYYECKIMRMKWGD